MNHHHSTLRRVLSFFSKQMKHTRPHSHLNRKFILIPMLIFVLLLMLRSAIPQMLPPATTTPSSPVTNPPTPLTQAIIYYATSKDVPQQTFEEIAVTAEVLQRRAPCNFLVFGLGHDSLMWASLNHGGRTIFLDEDEMWIKTVQNRLPSLESHHVAYSTKVSEADALFELARREECKEVDDVRSLDCPLALKQLPELVYRTEWDLIMVDAPTGYFAEAPGRMGAIYTAGMMARMRKEGETDVFVHDVDRSVEDKFSKEFLCKGFMKEQVGKLRHFTIPSYKETEEMAFCP